VSGKQSKKERKALREAERERLRQEERKRTIFTIIVIAVVVAIGGVLIWISLDDPGDELADPLDLEGAEGEDPFAEDDLGEEEIPEEERPIACGGTQPAAAGEEKQPYDEPEQVIDDGVAYQAVIETSCGTVVVDLDAQRSPEAVNNFVFLATEGFYDGLRIFRNATSIAALQSGSGTDDATWQMGYTLTDELESAEEEGYPPGSLAMANSGPDTAGSQFFLVYDDGFQEGVEAGLLEPVYTRFGMVAEGLEVLQEIGAIPTGGPMGESPQERIYIESVTILADGEPLEGAAPAADAPDEAAEPDEAVEPDEAEEEATE
jgi:peptidyl-prolyl cis-trans isomerase B (cyclophilin B)